MTDETPERRPPEPAEPTETEAEARRPPPPVDWSRVRKVHLLGISGSAMGAFAGMLRDEGYEVRGSDEGAYPPMSTFLREKGIPVLEAYRASNLDWGPDAAIVGNVIRPFNPEAVALRRLGIPHGSMPQAIRGLFVRDRHSVVVTGTHGKTTTSAMTAWLLHESGLDPAFLVGGVTGNFRQSYRVSGGPVFVVEGDEYDTAYFDKGPKFLHYAPRTASLNNVEFDHADIFPDIEAVERAFSRFVALLPPDGRLVCPADDPRALRIASTSPAPLWTTGLGSSPADVRATDLTPDRAGIAFALHLPGAPPLPTRLAVHGDHNVRNALVASALAFSAGAAPEAIARALPGFRLPLKRQQVKGYAGGVPVVDDFAHHPTAIRETLRAIRMRWPGRRVLALFEVESNTSRRRVFQDAFAQALAEADRVWFCRPLEKPDNLPPEARLDLPGLIADITSRGTPASLVPDIDALAREVAGEARPHADVVLCMSGRDFHGIHEKLLVAMASRFGPEPDAVA